LERSQKSRKYFFVPFRQRCRNKFRNKSSVEIAISESEHNMQRKIVSLKYSRQILVLLSLFLLLITSSSTAAQDTVNISVAYWGNNQEGAMIDAMLAAFEKANPTIKVERIWIPDSYEQKVTTMIAGGTPPDLVQISHTSLPGFVDAFAPV